MIYVHIRGVHVNDLPIDNHYTFATAILHLTYNVAGLLCIIHLQIADAGFIQVLSVTLDRHDEKGLIEISYI